MDLKKGRNIKEALITVDEEVKTTETPASIPAENSLSRLFNQTGYHMIQSLKILGLETVLLSIMPLSA